VGKVWTRLLVKLVTFLHEATRPAKVIDVEQADLMGISTFRIGQAALGELASLRREPGTASAGPLTPADDNSNKDVSTTFVPSTCYDVSTKASLAFNSFQLPLA
jgi:hypothetical protein